jgi:hypothetical protein
LHSQFGRMIKLFDFQNSVMPIMFWECDSPPNEIRLQMSHGRPLQQILLGHLAPYWENPRSVVREDCDFDTNGQNPLKDFWDSSNGFSVLRDIQRIRLRKIWEA